jgi:polar amino acid transport system permease protein
VSYVFQFGVVAEHFPRLLQGAWRTIWLTVLATLIGTALGIACAFLQRSRWRVVRSVVRGYVEFIRNTPFLIQLFVIFFSLPDVIFWLGRAVGLDLLVRLDPVVAALIGMSISLGGYATEIVRGGIDSVPRGQIEAGTALGLTKLQIFRLVILFPALKTAYPALASQFVLLLLGSSLVSAISVEELTGMMNTLRSTTFRDFEFAFVVTVLYLVMALSFRGLLGAVYWLAFARGRPAEAAR